MCFWNGGIRKTPGGQVERRVEPEPVKVVGIFIAAGGGEDARAQDIGQQMDDPVRIAAVGDPPGKPIGDAKALLRLREEHHPGVGGDPSANKGGGHPFARNRWKVKGPQGILVHKCSALLERGAASTRGIMPHILVSGYVRLLDCPDEVTE
jgi:hypothetical protein